MPDHRVASALWSLSTHNDSTHASARLAGISTTFVSIQVLSSLRIISVLVVTRFTVRVYGRKQRSTECDICSVRTQSYTKCALLTIAAMLSESNEQSDRFLAFVQVSVVTHSLFVYALINESRSKLLVATSCGPQFLMLDVSLPSNESSSRLLARQRPIRSTWGLYRRTFM